ELIRKDEMSGVSKIVRDIGFGILRIGEIVTVLVSSWNEIELVHSAAINGQHRTLKGMTDVAREHVRCVAQLDDLASRYRPGRRPMGLGEWTKGVVEGGIVFDKKNDMLDFS